jgi:hypothetical protein
MSENKITETIKLLKDFHKVDSAYQVTTFVGYRGTEDGSQKEITVRIMDFGANANPNNRFRADASWEGGQAASGDGPSVKAALGSMKWLWEPRKTLHNAPRTPPA